jgi:hypothetical protein
MNIDQLQTARKAEPFRPFKIHMADGRTFDIPHRDYLSTTLGGRTAIVYYGQDGMSIVDTLLMTEISFRDEPVALPNPSV